MQCLCCVDGFQTAVKRERMKKMNNNNSGSGSGNGNEYAQIKVISRMKPREKAEKVATNETRTNESCSSLAVTSQGT